MFNKMSRRFKVFSEGIKLTFTIKKNKQKIVKKTNLNFRRLYLIERLVTILVIHVAFSKMK